MYVRNPMPIPEILDKLAEMQEAGEDIGVPKTISGIIFDYQRSAGELFNLCEWMEGTCERIRRDVRASIEGTDEGSMTINALGELQAQAPRFDVVVARFARSEQTLQEIAIDLGINPDGEG
jgi:hypothetical protein